MCPVDVSGNVIQCLKFSNSVLLHMANESDADGQVEIFESAMIAKIANGWLVDNFDLEEAMEPPPKQKALDSSNGEESDPDVMPQSLPAGLIITIVMVILCLFTTIIFVERYQSLRNEDPAVENPFVGAEKRRRRKKWMKLTSNLLFVAGSVLYIVMAVNDFRYAKDLQTVPMSVRTADDDATWVNYKQGERAAASIGGVRRLMSRELGTATNAPENAIDTVADGMIVHAGFYDEYTWAELPKRIQEAAFTLGYDENSWDQSGEAWSADLFWDQLTAEAQEAARLLGYDRSTWDGVETDVGSYGYISYDDDYVFQVDSSDVWVSEYQIVYFSAALSFAIVGVLLDVNC